MSDRVFWALIVTLLLLSMLIWPAIDELRDWLAARGRVELAAQLADDEFAGEDLVDGAEHMCPRWFVGYLAAQGVEAVASTEAPLLWNPWIEATTCRHGKPLWLEPTSDQIAAWATRSVS